MIQQCAYKLLENLPTEIKNTNTNNKITKINLILEGGAFNGSYHIGALYFLKEMEKKKYIQIHHISATSVGSISALLFYSNLLDESLQTHTLLKSIYKKTKTLNAIPTFLNQIREKLPANLLGSLNGKLYISYYNIKTGCKIVKSKYKNIDDLFTTIRRSCFVPFFINGQMTIDNKYMDGITPYIFPKNKYKSLNISLIGSDKFHQIFVIKNEDTNIHKILAGLLDINLFITTNITTQMCSYINDHNIKQRLFYKVLFIIEKLMVFILFLYYHSKSKIYKSNIFVKILNLLIKEYCIS
jgi:hypothetical protein